MIKNNLGKILLGASLLFALTALFMIFAPSVVLKAEGVEKMTFSGIETAFGSTRGGLQYFASSAGGAVYLLLIVGIISIIFAAYGKGGRFAIVLSVFANLLAAVLSLSINTLCAPQIGFDLTFAAVEAKFSAKALKLGGGAIAGIVFSFAAAFCSTAYLLTNKEERKVFSTKWLTYTAMLTALVVATGYIPGIPVLTGKIYWCDFVIYLAAFIMDPLSATIVGGVGTTFFDLFGINGTAYNAIPSLLIHGLQGFTAATIFALLRKYFNKTDSDKREMVLALLSSIIPALIVILGYFIKRITWEGLLPEVAVLKMPANVLQEAVGIAVAFIICYVCKFKKQLKNAHLLPDIKKELLAKREQSPAEACEDNSAEACEDNSAEACEDNSADQPQEGNSQSGNDGLS